MKESLSLEKSTSGLQKYASLLINKSLFPPLAIVRRPKSQNIWQLVTAGALKFYWNLIAFLFFYADRLFYNYSWFRNLERFALSLREIDFHTTSAATV